MSWQGKTVLITGASSGIGRALVLELLKRGAKVGAMARRKEELQKLQVEGRAFGGTIETEIGDVTSRDSTDSALRNLQARLGPADVLIANAGTSCESGADPINSPAVANMMNVNYLGVVHAFEAVLPGMLARESGHVAAVSSLAAYKGLPGSAGYCASKAAVNAFCEALRIELKPRGIAVTAICPGFIRTALTANQSNRMPFLMNADEAARRMADGLLRRPKLFNFPWAMYRLMRLTYWAPDTWVRKSVVTPKVKT